MNREYEVSITVYVYASDPEDAVVAAMEQIEEIGDNLTWTVEDERGEKTQVFKVERKGATS